MVVEYYKSRTKRVCSGTQRELLITRVIESERLFSKEFLVLIDKTFKSDSICSQSEQDWCQKASLSVIALRSGAGRKQTQLVSKQYATAVKPNGSD